MVIAIVTKEFFARKTMPESYAVAVKTRHHKEWALNGLRFNTRDSAELYALQLRQRWRDVTDVEVQESTDPPNSWLPIPSDRYQVHRKEDTNAPV